MKKDKTITGVPFYRTGLKKGNCKTIFAICGIENLSRTGSKATFGWYSRLAQAIDRVINTSDDLYECCYDYVVIEEIKEGAYGLSVREWWFKWNSQKKAFIPIHKPKETNGIINWSM